MRLGRSIVVLVVMMGVMASGWASAETRRPRVHVGVHVGTAWHPWLLPPVIYPPVIVERAPMVYIEQAVPEVAPERREVASAYWYYCAASEAYYPYVRECPSGWQRIAPTPPDLPR